MVIGERLKAVRESKKLSQGHIEKATGLLRCYVSRVENGHTVPSIDTLEKWSRALDRSRTNRQNMLRTWNWVVVTQLSGTN
jgi:transcriptional regulator with XRE-family HTH domain